MAFLKADSRFFVKKSAGKARFSVFEFLSEQFLVAILQCLERKDNVRFGKIRRLILALTLVQIAISQTGEKLQIVGVGTTGPLTVYSNWFRTFEQKRPDLHISYIPSGSQTGIDMVTSGTADFGATDVPLTDQEIARAGVVQFATLVIAIVPIYNVPGLQRPLRFSPRVLAGIYLGTITRWNDSAIASANPDEQLPSSDIYVIHSAPGRGSTYIWSDYLSKISVAWRTRVGRGTSVQWPVGEEADGNGNLARKVRETANSIGYVELVHAMQNRLPFGQVQNAAGNFVSADSSSIAAATLAFPKTVFSNFRASITNPPSEKAYPVASLTWILLPKNMPSIPKQEAIKDFLRWCLKEGQVYVEPAGFTRLPKVLAEQEFKALERNP
jgi:phosphate transport system substrate-binding protein